VQQVQICPEYLEQQTTGSPPEHQLLSAYVLTALEDLHDKLHHQDARRWFLARSRDPFSFLWCCDQLQLDPGRLFAVHKA
jgi:hypothetical protein